MVKVVGLVRSNHPGMNLRDIYFKMRPEGLGRDRFEQLGKQLGLGVKRRKTGSRTTDSSGVKRFDNHLRDLAIVRVNQVWQSDITYYELGDRFFYLTFIQDACSKLIVGHSISKSLRTEETSIAALRMALRCRKQDDLKGLILHSDGGGQYYSEAYLKITGGFQIINSMGKEAYENGMAERLNGVIKNNYLKHRKITSYEQLVKEVDRSVNLYNHDKPHKSLGRRTPIEFERQLIKHAHFSGNVLGKFERHCQKNDSNNVEKPVNVF